MLYDFAFNLEIPAGGTAQQKNVMSTFRSQVLVSGLHVTLLRLLNLLANLHHSSIARLTECCNVCTDKERVECQV